MRGMILAGGLSTRLYPLTLDVPKPLVPVLDRPVVDHVINYLSAHGVDDIVISKKHKTRDYVILRELKTKKGDYFPFAPTDS